MERYVLVSRNKLPVVKKNASVNEFVMRLRDCTDVTEFNDVSKEGRIAYLAFGGSAKEMIDGLFVPNRAVLEFGRPASGIAGVIWKDNFIIVKKLPDTYAGLTDEEIKAAKRTFGKQSITQAHSLGFLP